MQNKSSSVTGQGIAPVWSKVPSVTRPGKWFYRATIDGVVYTVLQSWLTGLWHYQRDKEPNTGVGGFRTPQEAMAEVKGSL